MRCLYTFTALAAGVTSVVGQHHPEHLHLHREAHDRAEKRDFLPNLSVRATVGNNANAASNQASAAAASAAASSTSAPASQPTGPNVVVIMTDDQGTLTGIVAQAQAQGAKIA
jgi:hypothetical protein